MVDGCVCLHLSPFDNPTVIPGGVVLFTLGYWI